MATNVTAAEKATRSFDPTVDRSPLKEKAFKIVDVIQNIGSSMKDGLSMSAARAAVLILTFFFLFALINSQNTAFKEHEGLLPMTIIKNPKNLKEAQVGSPARASQDGFVTQVI